MQYLTDTHSHTYPASHDGKSTLMEMVLAAIEKGIAVLGFSNHIDYDYVEELMTQEEKAKLKNGDESLYFGEARVLQEAYREQVTLLVGAEFGFSPDAAVQKRYLSFYETYHPDYIINSVHSVRGRDYARASLSQDRHKVFRDYLQAVRESLDVPYPYDIVGHFEYLVRYVPFEDKYLHPAEFREEIDDILLTIIRKNKILEVNSSTYGLTRFSIPNPEILERYYILGGRQVTFGSDAHDTNRLSDKREQIISLLKTIGFTHLTIPHRGVYRQVAL